MNQLDDTYRDSLRRSLGSSFVNNEGAVVWVLEYLRYRLNGCNHGDATTKVLQQIRGQGIQPVLLTGLGARAGLSRSVDFFDSPPAYRCPRTRPASCHFHIQDPIAVRSRTPPSRRSPDPPIANPSKIDRSKITGCPWRSPCEAGPARSARACGATRAITAATVDGRTSGTSTSVTSAASSSGSSIASSPASSDDNCPCSHPGCSMTRARGSCARHRRAHRVDVRAGHHDDVRDAAFEERPDDPGHDGFARLTERQRGLGLAHSRRGAGGENDRRKSSRIALEISDPARRYEACCKRPQRSVRILDFPLLTCLHLPRFPRPLPLPSV